MSRRSIHRARRNSGWETGTDNHGNRQWARRVRGLPTNENLPRADVRSPFKKSFSMRDHRTGNLVKIPGKQALAMFKAIDPNYKPPLCTRAAWRR